MTIEELYWSKFHSILLYVITLQWLLTTNRCLKEGWTRCWKNLWLRKNVHLKLYKLKPPSTRSPDHARRTLTGQIWSGMIRHGREPLMVGNGRAWSGEHNFNIQFFSEHFVSMILCDKKTLRISGGGAKLILFSCTSTHLCLLVLDWRPRHQIWALQWFHWKNDELRIPVTLHWHQAGRMSQQAAV